MDILYFPAVLNIKISSEMSWCIKESQLLIYLNISWVHLHNELPYIRVGGVGNKNKQHQSVVFVYMAGGEIHTVAGAQRSEFGVVRSDAVSREIRGETQVFHSHWFFRLTRSSNG